MSEYILRVNDSLLYSFLLSNYNVLVLLQGEHRFGIGNALVLSLKLISTLALS